MLHRLHEQFERRPKGLCDLPQVQQDYRVRLQHGELRPPYIPQPLCQPRHRICIPLRLWALTLIHLATPTLLHSCSLLLIRAHHPAPRLHVFSPRATIGDVNLTTPHATLLYPRLVHRTTRPRPVPRQLHKVRAHRPQAALLRLPAPVRVLLPCL